jgi:phosphate transport system substrate-binding protein
MGYGESYGLFCALEKWKRNSLQIQIQINTSIQTYLLLPGIISVYAFIFILRKSLTDPGHMKTLVISATFIAVFCACTEKPEEMTGPTIGRLKILVDENLKDIISQEEQIFERDYKYAHLDIAYTDANEVFQLFLKDSIDAIITSRSLSDHEINWLKSKERIAREYPFATSALAFLQHRENPDTNVTYESMIEQLRNEELGKVFVIENMQSGIAEELIEHMQVQEMPSHVFAVQGQDGVLEYIVQNKNAIGIVDWSDISDSDQPYTKSFLEKVNVIGIQPREDSTAHGYFKPYQYNLGEYSFTRDLLFFSTTGRTDVGTGFASFLSGEVGQKIILKAGLFPKYQTERVIELKGISDIEVIE